MPAIPYQPEDLKLIAKYYFEALSEGGVPPGSTVGTGKVSVTTLVAEKAHILKTAAKRRIERAISEGFITSGKVVSKAGEYYPPELPPKDEDLDGVVEALMAEQDRQALFREASEWMPFKVSGDAPFALAFVGDPHLDTCDIRRLKSHVDLILSTPRMWAVGLGDWINGWPQKLRGQYAQQSMTERNAIRLAKWLLQQEIWWLILLGNHDGERWHGQMNPLRWIENASSMEPIDWQVKFSIQCGGSEWKIWAAHNFPGNSMYNAGHGPKKRALFTGAEADLYVAGDRHTFTLAQDQHEHSGRVFWTARARGYKPLDLYALELGHGDAGGRRGIGHSIGAVFDPADQSVVCFADLHKCAQYLRVLTKGDPQQ